MPTSSWASASPARARLSITAKPDGMVLLLAPGLVVVVALGVDSTGVVVAAPPVSSAHVGAHTGLANSREERIAIRVFIGKFSFIYG